ncbi:response regulator [Marichromatium gracile]|uniref:CHASE domain-containing hybrid sensor histidine kinase/response regulator n=1 Tax=Marichromatium gracile TaxID=1048 RepID=UPI0012904082|nr:response regulator [Marichromatium gracile]
MTSRLRRLAATIPLYLPLLLLAAGLALAVVVHTQLANENETTKRERFAFLVERVVDQLQDRMRIYEYGLRGARGAIISAGGDRVRLAEFRRYMASREHQREFPGSRGYGYISRVPPEQVAAFIARIRRDGRPEFDIRQLHAHDGERFVIQIIEPLEHNHEAIGLDIASESNRRQAAINAMRSGQPTLTAPITLVQASGKRLRSFLLLLALSEPVSAGDDKATPTVVGWAYTALVIDEVLADFDFRGNEFSLTLTDLGDNERAERFYSSPGSDTPIIGDLVARHTIAVYGRRWQIEIKVLPAFLDNLNLRDPQHVAGLIALFSALISGLLWIYLDNTRKRLQTAESRGRLAAIIESTDDAIIGQGLDDRVVSWNPAAERLFGYRAEEMIGRPPPKLDTKGNVEAWRTGLAQVRSGQTLRRFGIQHRHRDGRLIELAATISPVRNGDGGIIGLSYIVRDLSDYHRLEAQLRTTLSRMRLALDAAGIGIWEWQLDDNQLTWDQRMYAIYGLEQGHDGKPLDYTAWLSRIHPLDRPHVEERLRHQLLGEQTGELSFRIQHTSGEIRHIHSAALIERDQHGQPLQMVGINRDVTDKYKAEQALIDANRQLELKVGQRTHELLTLNERLREAVRQAEAATEAKSGFLANMSHEIRTPINAVLGLTYLLDQTALDDEQRRLVVKIHSASRALLALVNDILDFSKIEAGRLEVEHVPFSLGEVLENIATIMAPESGNHQVELIVGVPPKGVDTLYGDALRLQQVLTNLVSNALKFTEQGQVLVRVVRDESEPDQLRLHFSVKDTGIGIAPDKLQAIFQAFTQADTSTTRRFGGSGLGLAICRRLVEAMGGTLGATSEVGQGSEFWFTLPYTAAPTISQRPPLPRCNVLVVDDNEAARATLKACARTLGWDSMTASSGEEALALLFDRQPGSSPFDLLLIDWRMPGMDGIETVRIARDTLPSEQMPRVIMATAYGREHELATEIDALIHKPVTPSALYNAMQQIEQPTTRQPAGSATTPPAHQEPRLQEVRLLVVDDSEINREVARTILEGEGAEVHEAAHGREAVDWVEQHPQGVDLVLMDIQMPVMDGYMATREIRERLALPQLPVIALTAGAFQPQREAALAAGMDDFLPKPFDVDQMIATIRSHLGRIPTNGKGIEPPAPSHHDTEGSLPLLDSAEAMTRWRNATVYTTNLHRFGDEYANTGSKLHRLEESGDRNTIATLTHKLKGAAGNLGLKALQQAATELETAAHSGMSEQTRSAIDQLTRTMTASLHAIAEHIEQHPPPAAAAKKRSPRSEAETDALVQQLLEALDRDDPAMVRPLLDSLEPRIAPDLLAPIRDRLEAFDFRAAETATRRLIETLDTTLDG